MDRDRHICIYIWGSDCLRYLKHRDRLRQAQGDLYRTSVLKTGAQGAPLSNISLLGVLQQDQQVVFFPFCVDWVGLIDFGLVALFCLFRALQLLFALAFLTLTGKAIRVRLSFWVSNQNRFPGCQLLKYRFCRKRLEKKISEEYPSPFEYVSYE